MGLALRKIEGDDNEFDFPPYATPFVLRKTVISEELQPHPRSFISIKVIAIVLSAMQVLDGILTLVGISHYGVSVEGNPLIRSLMTEFGVAPVIVIMKSLSILLIGGLVLMSQKITWIKPVMGAISVFYLVAAILPWTFLLLTRAYA